MLLPTFQIFNIYKKNLLVTIMTRQQPSDEWHHCITCFAQWTQSSTLVTGRREKRVWQINAGFKFLTLSNYMTLPWPQNMLRTRSCLQICMLLTQSCNYYLHSHGMHNFIRTDLIQTRVCWENTALSFLFLMLLWHGLETRSKSIKLIVTGKTNKKTLP